MADAVAYQPETPEPRERQDTVPDEEHGDQGGWPTLPLPAAYPLGCAGDSHGVVVGKMPLASWKTVRFNPASGELEEVTV